MFLRGGVTKKHKNVGEISEGEKQTKDFQSQLWNFGNPGTYLPEPHQPITLICQSPFDQKHSENKKNLTYFKALLRVS